MKLDTIATNARKPIKRKGRRERAWRHSSSDYVPVRMQLVAGKAPDVPRMKIR